MYIQKKLITHINDNPSNLWSSSGLFDVYTKEAAVFDKPSDFRKEKLDKRQLQEYYGASLFSLRSHLVEKLKPEESEKV